MKLVAALMLATFPAFAQITASAIPEPIKALSHHARPTN